MILTWTRKFWQSWGQHSQTWLTLKWEPKLTPIQVQSCQECSQSFWLWGYILWKINFGRDVFNPVIKVYVKIKFNCSEYDGFFQCVCTLSYLVTFRGNFCLRTYFYWSPSWASLEAVCHRWYWRSTSRRLKTWLWSWLGSSWTASFFRDYYADRWLYQIGELYL